MHCKSLWIKASAKCINSNIPRLKSLHTPATGGGGMPHKKLVCDPPVKPQKKQQLWLHSAALVRITGVRMREGQSRTVRVSFSSSLLVAFFFSFFSTYFAQVSLRAAGSEINVSFSYEQRWSDFNTCCSQ